MGHSWWRKYSLAAFTLVVSAVALFLGFIDGGTWVAAASLALALYGAANVTEKRLMKSGAADGGEGEA